MTQYGVLSVPGGGREVIIEVRSRGDNRITAPEPFSVEHGACEESPLVIGETPVRCEIDRGKPVTPNGRLVKGLNYSVFFTRGHTRIGPATLRLA